MCCGHNSNRPTFRNRRDRQPSAMRNTMSRNTIMLPQQGMTLMGFLGRGNAIRTFYGENKRYLFGGKHHMTGNVLDSDVEIFLGMHENGKPLFEIVKIVKTPALKPVVVPESVAPVETLQPSQVEEAVAPKRTRKKKTDVE